MLRLYQTSFLFLLLVQLIEINHGDTRVLHDEAEILSEQSKSSTIVSSDTVMEDYNKIRNLQQVQDISFLSTLDGRLSNDAIIQYDISQIGKNVSVAMTATNMVLSEFHVAGFDMRFDAMLSFTGIGFEKSEPFEAYVVLKGVHVKMKLNPYNTYKLIVNMNDLTDPPPDQTVGICILLSSSWKKGTMLDFNLDSYESPVYKGDVTSSIRILVDIFLNDIRDNENGLESLMTKEVYANFFKFGVIPVIMELLHEYSNSTGCEVLVMASQYLDFRDFFLSVEDSRKLGGTGMHPYGDVGTTVYTLITGLLEYQDGGELLGINEIIPPKLTFLPYLYEDVNRTEIKRDGSTELVGFFTALGIDAFFVELKDGYIDNLNTFIAPLDILKPSENPHVLKNRVELGDKNLPLTARIDLRFGVDGTEGSPFAFEQNVTIIVAFESMTYALDLLGTVDAPKLLRFNVDNLLDPPCWGSIIPVSESEDIGLKVKEFSAVITGLDLMMNCTTCTTSINTSLNKALSILEEDDLAERLSDQLAGIVNEVMSSDAPTEILNHFLNTSKTMCSLNNVYDENAEYDTNFTIIVPPFSRRSVETIVLLFTIIVQIVAVTFVNLIINIQLAGTDADADADADVEIDPLKYQSLLESSDVDFLDFNTIDEKRMDVPDFDVFDMIEAGLSFAGGNNFLSSNILSSVMGMLGFDEAEGGLFGDTISFDLDLGYEVEGNIFKLGQVRISGLDSLNKLDLFRVIGAQTISNEIQMDYLRIEGDFYLLDAQTTPFVVVFEFEELDLVASMLVAIDNGKLNSLRLQNFLNLTSIASCIGSIFHRIELTEFFLTFGKVNFLNVTGFETDVGIDAQTIQSRIGDYLNEFVASAPIIFDEISLFAINTIIEEILSISNVFCETGFHESSQRYVDFRDLILPPDTALLLGGSGEAQYGDLAYKLIEVVDSFLVTDDGNISALINNYIPFDSENGISLDGELIRFNDAFSFMGFRFIFDMSIKDLSITHLNTLGKPLEFLGVKNNEPHILNNTATLGVGAEPLRIEMRTDLNFVFGESEMVVNDFNISFDMRSLTVLLGGLIKVHEKKFMNYPITQLLNTDCLLTLIEFNRTNFISGVRIDDAYAGIVITDLMLTLQQLNVGMDCNRCDSPAIIELSRMLLDPASSDEIKTSMDDLLQFVIDQLRGKVIHDMIDRRLEDASRKCVLSPNFDPYASTTEYANSLTQPIYKKSYSLLYVSLVAFSAVIAMAYFTLNFIQQIANKRNQKWMMALSKEDYNLYKDKENRNEELKLRINKTSWPLIMSSEIPLLVRLSVPIIVIVNTALFASGHVNLGANANLYITLFGDSIEVKGVYQMSILESTVDLWRLGSKPAALIIACVSIIWPYVKQTSTLIMWLVPTNYCTVAARGRILLWLDNLAKWSMVDIMALIISVVALKIALATPQVDYLPGDLIGFDIWIVPKWGLYANLIAQVLSQVSSHFIIHYHRKVAHAIESREIKILVSVYGQSLHCVTERNAEDNSDWKGEGPDSELEARKESLQAHSYVRQNKPDDGRLLVKQFVGPMLISIGAITILLFIVSTAVYPSIEFETYGIFGLIEEAAQGGKEAVFRHNVIDLINVHIEESKFLGTIHDFIGITSFWLLLIISVLFVPIFQVIGLLCIWFIPMTPFYLRRMMIVNECLTAWQYSEPFMLAVIIEVWQIEQLSNYLVNPLCRSINPFLYELNYYDMIKDEDAQCFKRVGSPGLGMFVMFAGVCCLYFLDHYVTKAAKQYLRELNNLDTLTNTDRRFSLNMSMTMKSADESPDEHKISERKSERQLIPFPFLFTDTFGWTIQKQEKMSP